MLLDSTWCLSLSLIERSYLSFTCTIWSCPHVLLCISIQFLLAWVINSVRLNTN